MNDRVKKINARVNAALRPNGNFLGLLNEILADCDRRGVCPITGAPLEPVQYDAHVVAHQTVQRIRARRAAMGR